MKFVQRDLGDAAEASNPGPAGMRREIAFLLGATAALVLVAYFAIDTRGFIHLIRDRDTDRLIGARVLAAEGGELLMEAALAIRHGIKVAEIAAAFHPYLTLSEGIKLAALSFGKDVRKLSCCAA